MGVFGGNRRVGIALVSVGQFVVVLDATAVTTALPAIGADLGVGLTNLQWVLSAYSLAFAGFLVVGGRVSDLLGARRAFAVALLGFTLASLACGLAPGLGLLVAARLVQGLCAALLSPAALTLLSALQAPDGRRDSAVAAWTAVGAGGGASGWLVGGLLAEHADWRWVFLVNVPVGLVALALVRRQLPVVARRGGRDLDLPGALAATTGLALVVWGLTQVGGRASSPLAVALPLLGGAAVLAWFHRHELRTLQPLLPESLLADRATRGANLVALLSTAATTAAVVLGVLYLEDVLRMPAGRAAWYFPAFNLTVVAGSLLGPRALRRAGSRRVAVVGLVLVGVGAGVPPALNAQLDPSVWLPVTLGLMGLGLGAAAVSSTGVGLSRGAAADRGVASGVLTSAAQVGNAVGFAFAVPFSTGSAAGGGLGAMGWGFLTSAALAAIGACCARLLPRHSGPEQAERPRVQVGSGAGTGMGASVSPAAPGRHLGSALVRRRAKEQPCLRGTPSTGSHGTTRRCSAGTRWRRRARRGGSRRARP